MCKCNQRYPGAIINPVNRTNPSIIRTGGDADLAFAVVVLASYFATFSSLQEAEPFKIVLLISLGTAYLAIGIYGYAFCARSKSVPFSLFYRPDSDGIVIFAISHHARRPGYWVGAHMAANPSF